VSLNYPFMVRLAAQSAPPGAKLLDFGCGGGEVVRLAQAAGFDAWGVDTYEDVWQQYAHGPEGSNGRVLRVAPDAPLPFPDASFDIVVTNMALEHVRDLRAVAGEIARILRPDGVLLAAFPTREIWAEPHLGAPFVHRCANGSWLQRALLAARARLGNLGGMPRAAWRANAEDMLRRHVFYRTQRQALATFAPALIPAGRREADYLRFRIEHSRLAVLLPLANLPALEPLLRWLCIRLATAVFVLRRASPRSS